MKKQPILLLIALMSSISLFAGGPWPQKKGGGYAQVSYTFIPKYRSLYINTSDDNTLLLNREVSDITISAYGEYGISEKLTLLAELPYKAVKSNDDVFNSDFSDNLLDAGSLNSIGNISIAALHNFYRQKLLVSGRLRLEAPTASSDAATGLRSGVDAWGIFPSVIVGGSHKNFYAYADAGLRFRTNSYSNEFILNGEAGVSLLERFWLIGVLDVRESVNDGTADNENAEQTGLYPDNQEYLSFGIKLIVELSEKIGLNISGFGASGGNLVAKSPANTIGLYYRW